MKATIVDIAKLAGVSVATVSRVINNYPHVHPETRRKILELMGRIQYRPNLVARSMVLQRTHTIGLIVGSLTNPFYAETAEIIMDTARKLGSEVVLCVTSESSDKLEDCIELLLNRRVDGIIIGVAKMNEPILDMIPEDIPCVYYNRRPVKENVDFVVSDNFTAGFKATQHLIENGHRMIAMISGSHSLWTTNKQLGGYREALAKHGLAHTELVIERDFQGGMSAMEIVQRLKSHHKPVTAIMATDVMALPIMDCLYEIGVRVPEDIALVGFDNVQVSSLRMVQLTSVARRSSEMARLSVERLLERVEDKSIMPGTWQITLTPELIVRKSSSYQRK